MSHAPAPGVQVRCPRCQGLGSVKRNTQLRGRAIVKVSLICPLCNGLGMTPAEPSKENL